VQNWLSAHNILSRLLALNCLPACLQVQNRLGADIIMALDDVVPSTAADDARCMPAAAATTVAVPRPQCVGTAKKHT
jgi:hypothetical protein